MKTIWIVSFLLQKLCNLIIIEEVSAVFHEGSCERDGEWNEQYLEFVEKVELLCWYCSCMRSITSAAHTRRLQIKLQLRAATEWGPQKPHPQLSAALRPQPKA